MNQATKQLTDDWVRGSADQLVQSAQSVDAKMVGTMAAGSVVIGVAATAVGGDEPFAATPSLIPLILAVVSYAVILMAAFVCLRPHDFRRPLDPVALKGYWTHTPEQAKKWHSDLVLKCYKINLAILNKKTKALSCGLVSLALETTGIVAWIVLAGLGL